MSAFLPLSMPVWALVVLGVLVVTAAGADLKLKRVPNWLTYPAIVAALAGHWATGGLGLKGERLGLAGSLAGLAAGFLPMLLCWLAGGLGGGDAKLMAAVGALGGWEFAISVMLYSFMAAALMGLVVMVRRRLVRRTLRRVWRTLVLLVVPAGRPVGPAEADSPTIPFAVAVCVGAAVAAAEVLVRSWLAQVP